MIFFFVVEGTTMILNVWGGIERRKQKLTLYYINYELHFPVCAPCSKFCHTDDMHKLRHLKCDELVPLPAPYSLIWHIRLCMGHPFCKINVDFV